MDFELLDFPRHCDPRGDLTAVEHPRQLPFELQRAYWLYNVPCDSERGGHSHRSCHECLVAVAGSFDVELDNGKEKVKVTLNRPYQGLWIKPGTWRELRNFTSSAVCLVLASEPFSELDYIRDYTDFLAENS